MVTQADVHQWAEGLDVVVGQIAPRFGRTEPRRRAAAGQSHLEMPCYLRE